MPAVAAGWSDERIRVVACHELAHVRRHDWAVQMAADLAAPPLLVPTLDVDRVPASCGAKANTRATTWCWPPGSRRRRMPDTCCRSPGPDDRITDGSRPCRWPAVPVSRGESPPCSTVPAIVVRFHPGRSSCPAFVLAVAMLSAAAVHTEQTRSGQLLGTIYDGSGAVLPGVEVSLSTGQDAKSKATTRRRGTFLVSQCGARPLRARGDPARLHRRAAGVRAERSRRLGPRADAAGRKAAGDHLGPRQARAGHAAPSRGAWTDPGPRRRQYQGPDEAGQRQSRSIRRACARRDGPAS